MEFSISDKAREYLKEKDINEFFMDLNVKKSGCCTVPRTEGDFFRQATQGRVYKDMQVDDISIHYDPFLEKYIPNGEKAEIDLTGLGPFRRIYLKNSINPFRDITDVGEDHGNGQ